jgi:hypothetical protein
MRTLTKVAAVAAVAGAAGLAVGVLGGLLRRFRPQAAEEGDTFTEPVLGYDGMDQETVIDWLERAGLDGETLRTVEIYERANRRREPVLETLQDLLG